MDKGIYIGDAVKFGWKTMKANGGFFICLLLAFWLITVGSQILAGFLEERIISLSIIFYIIAIVLEFALTLGFIKICIMFCDNQKVTIGDLFSCFHLFRKYVYATILYMVIVVVGFVLLIFPGVIWAIKFGFYPYFIVDKNQGVIDSLKASSRITMGAKWDLLGFCFVVFIINLLGMVCLIIGLFATVPTTMVAIALIYRKLLSQTESPQPQATEATAA